jgi:predicted aspartyl protease
MKYILVTLSLLFVSIGSNIASTKKPTTSVSMQTYGASTYYVKGEILGLGSVDLMVDTGSGYSTINEQTLSVLKQNGTARYVKDLVGVLANGDKMRVQVYRLSAINIGGQCWLHDVDAAVFPGKTRQILGLSALRKTSPFMFSMEPPELRLSNCKAHLES